MNVYSFTGNLGRDCRTAQVSGTDVCNFTVAVKSGYGQNEETLWIDCALWGQRASGGLVQYLMKGQQVAVTGELGTREWTNDQGETKTQLTCRVNNVTLIGKRGDSGDYQPEPQQQSRQQAPQQKQAPAAQQGGRKDWGDDVPFNSYMRELTC